MASIPTEQRYNDTPALLSRSLPLSLINGELLTFVGVVVLSILAHLYGLERMALHHDESIHAWMSWKFITGNGGFSCFGGRSAPTYCYEPTYHGPALYIFTFLSYFLFGDGDWQARLPQAMAGIGMVASVWMLRPYLGKYGTLIAATLLAFSPSLLYFTRFARHDGLILLWTLWMVIGFFRYLDTGRSAYLVLMAAGMALAISTHELYYILFFIFGWFLIIRTAFELLPRRTIVIALAVLMGVAIIIELWNPSITENVRAGGLALLFLTTAALGLLMTRVWDEHAVLVHRLAELWHERRTTLWTALAVLIAIYTVMYSTFFADIRGLVDGLYAGISYWLGSQQKFARGDQPWYYHLMLMALYEPLALYGGFATVIYLFTRGWGRDTRGWRMKAASPVVEDREEAEVERQEAKISARSTADDSADSQALSSDVASDGKKLEAAHANQVPEIYSSDELSDDLEPQPLTPEPVAQPAGQVAIFPLFLAFWFIGCLVAFSWAGEKMPWLVTHIALPANLLIAWALGKLLDAARRPNQGFVRLALVPPVLTLMLVGFGVAYWRLSTAANDQAGQSSLLQGIVPLAIGGALLYALLNIAQRSGWRRMLAMAALTIAALMGLYTIRATWMVVYDHPDTPVEPLIYVQSTPDVPLIVKDIRELAISQTRNYRSASDPVGGLTMPVIMDTGDTAQSGEGSLAWPYQWYFRDLKRLESRDANFFRNATPESFLVDPIQPGGEKIFAPVVMISKADMNENTRSALRENYVLKYDSKLNWWFPEGNKCDPKSPGYKRFYYNTSMLSEAIAACPNIDETALGSVFAPLLWPFDSSHWSNTVQYLLYRRLPEPLRVDGREMEVWVRSDLVGSSSNASSPAIMKLVAQQSFSSLGSGPDQLNTPSAAANDSKGNLYVADTMNHRIQVFAPDGSLLRSIGTQGNGEGQFLEPRGVALDSDGNIYVADTWNARVVKLSNDGSFIKAWGTGTEDFGGGRRAGVTDGTLAGNTAAPLNFFGPRGIAVDKAGNVYVADTGNKRIVVTDSEGNLRYQFGEFGAAAGQFSEPTGVAVDDKGQIYVADTWNGRVQVFAAGQNGQANPTPLLTWRVPGWFAQTYDDPSISVHNGQVAVSVPGSNAVLLTDSAGNQLLRWGGAGTDLASLKLPSGLSFAPDGTLYVVDRGNGRIMHFKLPTQ